MQLISLKKLSIAPGASNDPVGAPAHELMHALGFLHEHTRFDRDDWVTVRGTESSLFFQTNFAKHPNSIDIKDHGSYDLKSIMHYGLTNYPDPTNNTTISMNPTPSAQRVISGQNVKIALGLYFKCCRCLFHNKPEYVSIN